MPTLKTKVFNRKLISWSPYVRLIDNYPKVLRVTQECVLDHALHYFKKARGVYLINDNEYTIQDGTVFLVRPEQKFKFKLGSGCCGHMLNIHFDIVEQNDSFFTHPYPADVRTIKPLVLPDVFPEKVTITNCKNYENVFFELHSIFLLEGYEWALRKKSLMLNLLSIIYDNSQPAKERNIQRHRLMVQKTLGYIYNNLHRKVTLDELVKQSGVSRVLFINAFKKECGLSPKKFVYKAKVEKAKSELSSGHYPIKEIADNLGFADVHHFSRIFKEFSGHAPGQYKKGTE